MEVEFRVGNSRAPCIHRIIAIKKKKYIYIKRISNSSRLCGGDMFFLLLFPLLPQIKEESTKLDIFNTYSNTKMVCFERNMTQDRKCSFFPRRGKRESLIAKKLELSRRNLKRVFSCNCSYYIMLS